ncbi:MAG: hypothetical protein FWH27_10780 [Planctomycetaceae bacterium]|nr:hypothetical protein [Planctomycetaceae bacterium]
MKADAIIEQETQKVKLLLDWKAGKIGKKFDRRRCRKRGEIHCDLESAVNISGD